jgi:RNA polymerase sigma factor (sigma-70 family)
MTGMSGSGRTPDEAKLESIFRRHYSAVAGYVRRRAAPQLADDVVAETFLVAWRRLDDVPNNALPWLLRVARNVLATQQRSATRRGSLLAKLRDREKHADSRDSGGGPDVARALSELSERDREAITLIAWDGLSPAEAAAVLGLAPASFRVRLHRARERLRAKLEPPTQLRFNASEPVPGNEIPLIKGGLRG